MIHDPMQGALPDVDGVTLGEAVLEVLQRAQAAEAPAHHDVGAQVGS